MSWVSHGGRVMVVLQQPELKWCVVRYKDAIRI